MIATPKKPKPELTREHHQQRFLAMLPTITRVARQTFSDLDAEAKEEAVAEVVATALVMFVGLIERGKEDLAYATVLAAYSIRRVRTGRLAASTKNIGDVSSIGYQLPCLVLCCMPRGTMPTACGFPRLSALSRIASTRADCQSSNTLGSPPPTSDAPTVLRAQV